jgi:hypothetical protein
MAEFGIVNAELGRGRRAEGSKLKVGDRGYRADDRMQKAEKSEGEKVVESRSEQ